MRCYHKPSGGKASLDSRESNTKHQVSSLKYLLKNIRVGFRVLKEKELPYVVRCVCGEIVRVLSFLVALRNLGRSRLLSLYWETALITLSRPGNVKGISLDSNFQRKTYSTQAVEHLVCLRTI